MEYTDIIKQEVKKSLRSILILDDQYVDPGMLIEKNEEDYELRSFEPQNIDLDSSIRIAKSFNNSDASSKIITYDNDKTIFDELMKKIYNADLLVLDWELDPRNTYIPLDILKKIAEARTPSWIYIYTHLPEMDRDEKILQRILACLTNKRFHPPEDKKQSDILNDIGEAAKKSEIWKGENVVNIIDGEINFNDEKIEKFFTDNGIDRNEYITVCKPLFELSGFASEGSDGGNEFLKFWICECLLDERSGSNRISEQIIFNKPINSAVEGKPGTYNIKFSGLSIFIRSKELVSPEQLTEEITQSIVNENESIINAISLFVGNNLRSGLPLINGKFDRNHDNAVFWHLSSNNNVDTLSIYIDRVLDQIRGSVRESYYSGELISNEFYQKFQESNADVSLLKEAKDGNFRNFCNFGSDEEIKEISVKDDLLKYLRKYGAEINNYLCTYDFVKKDCLQFGQVFKDRSGKYFLCISASCDCFRPTDNLYFIDRDSQKYCHYAFVIGKKAESESAFKDLTSETKSFSFIRENNDVFPIQWTTKIVTIPARPGFLNSEDGAYIEIIDFENKPQRVLFIQQVREQFVHNIVGKTASRISRAGVDWLEIKK